jgi:ligand-binding SRPBCC domain-containing protein
MPNSYRLERTQFIPRPLPEVFAFFADAKNLEAITPAFLHFHVTTSGPIQIQAGTRIEYRLRLFGIPFGWQTLIESFEPPHYFSDIQLRGPYRRWHHRHEFRPVPGGTEMLDCVDYALPLGPLGSFAHILFVRRMLGKIFDHRAAEIARLFTENKETADERG